MTVLMIDNYDSFTWNLVQRIGELDPAIRLEVVRNDKITPDEAEAMSPSHVIISPGPGTPADAGVSSAIIDRFAGRVPVLGVCLGHQCIGALGGMVVARHSRIMHGKTSAVFHDGAGVFRGLPNPFVATRYHSLVILDDPAPPPQWQVSAWTEDELDDGTRRRVIMGLRRVDSDLPVEGVQFHPESFLTIEGPRLLANFLGLPAPSRGGTHAA